MNKALDAAPKQQIGWRRPVALSVDTLCERDQFIAQTFPHTERYILIVKLATEFDCHPSSYIEARKIAQKVMLQGIYADVLPDMIRLRGAVASGHAEDVCAILDRMQANMGL